MSGRQRPTSFIEGSKSAISSHSTTSQSFAGLNPLGRCLDYNNLWTCETGLRMIYHNLRWFPWITLPSNFGSYYLIYFITIFEQAIVIVMVMTTVRSSPDDIIIVVMVCQWTLPGKQLVNVRGKDWSKCEVKKIREMDCSGNGYYLDPTSDEMWSRLKEKLWKEATSSSSSFHVETSCKLLCV